MRRIKRLPGIAVLAVASCLLLLRLERVVEAPSRTRASGRGGVLRDAAGAPTDPSQPAAEVASEPVDAAPTEPVAGARTMELVFEGITETWRGREAFLHVWDHRELNERIRVEVSSSVLCRVSAGSWEYMLCDDMNRIVSNPGSASPSDTTLRFNLPAGCRVEGTISTADRSPFVGELCVGGASHVVATTAQGAFDAGFVSEGAHPVCVLCKSAGFVTVGRIEVRGEGTMRVHVAMRGSGGFRGVVRWEPIEGLDLSMTVLRAGQTEPAASMHPEGGPFEMDHMEAGSYELRSIALASPVTFRVWAGQCTDLGTIEPLPPIEWRWREDREEAEPGN